ncbi:hypothetical protein PP301_gp083 [Gordonia phage GMA2]|uniref:Uncharacterized protein n=1 Tax=Gordonia phage GMA2 TaxID=1647283 RepID=A0A0K0N6S3_9CAUD|nr:hypothetical protein PP301_gp083 [Gordonia phage GMA2]AKJ72639.1 hypothetical protein GMA2_101 [Gordonia phage GMA2]
MTYANGGLIPSKSEGKSEGKNKSLKERILNKKTLRTAGKRILIAFVALAVALVFALSAYIIMTDSYNTWWSFAVGTAAVLCLFVGFTYACVWIGLAVGDLCAKVINWWYDLPEE